MSTPEPTEEELRAAYEDQMRQIDVIDVIFQTVVTLVNLGGRRLGLAPDAPGEKDLRQGRMAIEATRALVPLLPAEESAPIVQALTQLQMAYAREAKAGAPEGPEGEHVPAAEPAPAGEPPPPGQAPSPQPPGGGASAQQEEAERAKARARIWTPPGT